MISTGNQAGTEVRGNSGVLKPWKIFRIAHLKLRLLINYVLHPEFMYLTVCIRIDAKTDRNVVRMTARINTDYN